MQTLVVTRAFDEHEGKKLVRHKRGDEITITNDRAEQLRTAGLVQGQAQKPTPRKQAEKPASTSDPETAE